MTKQAVASDKPTSNDSGQQAPSGAGKFTFAPEAVKAMNALATLMKDPQRAILRGESPGMWINLGLERQPGVLVEIPIGADFGLVGDPNCKLSSIEDLLLGLELTNVMGIRRFGAWDKPNGFAKCCANPLILSAVVPLNQIAAVEFKGSSEVDTKVVIGSLKLLNVCRIGLFRAPATGDWARSLTKSWVHRCVELEGIVSRLKLLEQAPLPQDKGTPDSSAVSETGCGEVTEENEDLSFPSTLPFHSDS